MAPKAPAKKVDEKKVQKIVEDKTFGLKNKNKSKKVQEYVKQVQASAKASASGQKNMKSAEWYAAQEAKKKQEKEEKKRAEREMLKLLSAVTVDKKKEEEKRKKEEEEKKRKEAEQYEHDFGVPITALEQIFRVDGKASVVRACGELVWKDNLAGRTKDGSKECLYIKISDGSTRLPLPCTLIGWTPSTLNIKTGAIVDIRDAVAMVRGETVDLEVTLGVGTVTEAGTALSEHIREMKREQDEIRERGGIPLEELIEEQRAKLKFAELTPVTAERFLEWKAKKMRAKAEAAEKMQKELEAKAKSGANVLTGRQLFAYDPSLFKDDEGAMDKIEVSEQQPSDSEEENRDFGGQEGEEEEEEEEEEDHGGEEEEEEEEDGGDEEEGEAKRALAEEEDVDLDELEDD